MASPPGPEPGILIILETDGIPEAFRIKIMYIPGGAMSALIGAETVILLYSC